MNISEYIKNDQTGIAEKYLASSQEVYAYLGIDLLSFDFDNVDNKLSFNFFADQKFQAHAEIVHGGIVASVCDTAMGVLGTVLVVSQKSVVFTATMNINYLKPMKTGLSYRVVAQVQSWKETRLVMSTTIENDRGETIVQSEAVFIQKHYEN